MCGVGEAGDGLVFGEGVEDELLVAGVVGDEGDGIRLRGHGFVEDGAAHVMLCGGGLAHEVRRLGLFYFGVKVVLGKDGSDHVQGPVLWNGFLDVRGRLFHRRMDGGFLLHWGGVGSNEADRWSHSARGHSWATLGRVVHDGGTESHWQDHRGEK